MRLSSRHGRLHLWLALALIASATAMGMAFVGGHDADWYRCLGILDDASRQNAKVMLETISNEMDSVDKWYGVLKHDFPDFTWGSYTHRLFFHWGFNAGPRKYRPLFAQVSKTLPEERREAFYDAVTKEQKRRNGNIIRAVENGTGIVGQASRGLATVIYDIHLLGDYDTTNVTALPDLPSIVKDMKVSGFGRLMADDDTLYEAIGQKMDQAMSDGATPDEKARKLKDVVAEQLPSILLGRYGRLLREKEIQITASRAPKPAE